MTMFPDDATFDAVHDLMDQVQRVNQKLNRLCERAGIDPDEAGRLPGERPSLGVVPDPPVRIGRRPDTWT
jgi:hypothetical protein